MVLRGTDPESYITESTSVYEDNSRTTRQEIREQQARAVLEPSRAVLIGNNLKMLWTST